MSARQIIANAIAEYECDCHPDTTKPICFHHLSDAILELLGDAGYGVAPEGETVTADWRAHVRS